MNKKVAVVLGGAGFIGSHLCDELLNKDMHVICVDNLITGSEKNLKHLSSEKQFNFIKQDVTDYLEIKGNVDYILHLASPASPVDYLKYPIQTLKAGALGTHKALGLAKEKNATFLLASTSEVYGDPLVHPQSEDYWGNVNPIGPRGVYDEAKRYAEALTMAYHRYHKINTKIVRIFNTYGTRMRLNDGRALPAFVSQALTHQDITVFGNGNQTRSFCYVKDMVEGIVKLLFSEINNPINIGNPEEISILKFAQIVKEITNSKSKIVFNDLPVDDPKVRQPDITLAKKYLNWEPKVKLETGLNITIEYFRKILEIK